MCVKTVVHQTSTSAQRHYLQVPGPIKSPLTPCLHQQVIYCFNYRQKEYQKDFITTLIGMTPAGLPRGQRGSPSLFTKMSSGPGKLKWMHGFRALSSRCMKRLQKLNGILNNYASLHLNDK